MPNIVTGSVQVANALRQAILAHELKPGTRLREIELTEWLGVSRSPIREAFRILESEGLVQIAPNKGAYITQLNNKDLEEIYELRLILESYGIQLACERMTEEDLNKLNVILQEMDEKLRAKDYLGYLTTSHSFHEFYLKKCDNERLFNFFKILRNNILAVQIFAYSYPDHSTDSLEEHKRIFKALKEREKDNAEKLLRGHLRAGYHRATKFLNRPQLEIH